MLQEKAIIFTYENPFQNAIFSLTQMDPPPPPTATTTTAAAVEPPHSHSLPPLPTSKIRLMCSYGGHIVPRPQTKSLCYAGGETRIVAVDRRTTASTISSLTHHLSRTLYGNRPFTLKYQLPNEDLDSLVSITSDEDLHNMLEEHDRIATSPTPSRIRLFLFPTRPESVGSLLLDPKSESWFSDALKSTMIINRGLSDGSGMPNGLIGLDCLEGNGDSLTNSGESGKCGGAGAGDSGSVPESMVLETCSSFGSINSSVSASNLTPVGVNNEVKVAPPASIESDNTARIYQDQLLPESESIIYNPSSPIQMQKNVQVSGYQVPHIADQRQQPVQYIHSASPHYIPYPTGTPFYYPMYVPYQQPQPQPHPQPNQAYPVYVLPGGPTDRSSSIPAPTHIANSHVAYKEVRVVSQPPAERVAVAPQGPQPTPSNRVPAHPAQPVGPAVTPTPTYENEYDNDLVYAQIYKSQPSAPAFPPQKFETVKKAEQVPLPDSLTQLSIGVAQQ